MGSFLFNFIEQCVLPHLVCTFYIFVRPRKAPCTPHLIRDRANSRNIVDYCELDPYYNPSTSPAEKYWNFRNTHVKKLKIGIKIELEHNWPKFPDNVSSLSLIFLEFLIACIKILQPRYALSSCYEFTPFFSVSHLM